VNLIIDIGNTAAKLAVFSQGKLQDTKRCSNQSLEGLGALCNQYPIKQGILSTVISLGNNVLQELRALPFPVMTFTHNTPIPIKNLYETPQTLGTDRLAAVVEAHMMHPNRPILVIDAGTCITFDFIDESGQYHGGNISPGIDMRFKALHAFTSKLPEIGYEGETPSLGTTTTTAIRSGVIKGVEHEINGYIHHFQKNYPTLLVFLTSRIDFSFDTKLKSSIFADSFLVLKGLNRILEYNEAL